MKSTAEIIATGNIVSRKQSNNQIVVRGEEDLSYCTIEYLISSQLKQDQVKATNLQRAQITTDIIHTAWNLSYKIKDEVKKQCCEHYDEWVNTESVRVMSNFLRTHAISDCKHLLDTPLKIYLKLFKEEVDTWKGNYTAHQKVVHEMTSIGLDNGNFFAIAIEQLQKWMKCKNANITRADIMIAASQCKSFSRYVIFKTMEYYLQSDEEWIPSLPTFYKAIQDRSYLNGYEVIEFINNLNI